MLKRATTAGYSSGNYNTELISKFPENCSTYHFLPVVFLPVRFHSYGVLGTRTWARYYPRRSGNNHCRTGHYHRWSWHYYRRSRDHHLWHRNYHLRSGDNHCRTGNYYRRRMIDSPIVSRHWIVRLVRIVIRTLVQSFLRSIVSI